MLENPEDEIFDVIRRFGERGRIFNVHFPNIRSAGVRGTAGPLYCPRHPTRKIRRSR